MPPRRGSKHRTSGAVVYNPGAHREFVTGFRKRKQERRAQATKDIAIAEKQARRDDRKQRRAILKRTADRARGFADTDDEDEEEAGDKDGKDGKGGKGGKDGKGGQGRGRGAVKVGLMARHRDKARAAESAPVSKVYDGANDARVTTTVTPIETYGDTNFLQRLPNAPRVPPPRKAAEVVPEGEVGKKRTRSGAKKLSKMHRHSKIQKIRRDRQSKKSGAR